MAALYKARMPFYELADIAVDSAPDMSVEQMAARVAAALMEVFHQWADTSAVADESCLAGEIGCFEKGFQSG